MTITFYPKPGTVLLCDFSIGFKVPEIIKVRPVIVVSPSHMHNSELYTVVPLSRTAPKVIRPYHFKFDSNPVPIKKNGADSWAKCDMLMTVSRERLDRFKLGRGRYEAYHITQDELAKIRICLKIVLGIS